MGFVGNVLNSVEFFVKLFFNHTKQLVSWKLESFEFKRFGTVTIETISILIAVNVKAVGNSAAIIGNRY